MARDISLHHLSRLSASPTELAVAAAVAGFSHCGLRIIPVEQDEPLVDVVRDESALDGLRTALSDRHTAVLDVEAVWLRPTTVVADLDRSLAVARSLGAAHVLAVGYDNCAQRLVDNLVELADLAAAHGLTVALESITYSSIADLDAAATIVARSARPNLGLLVDALQFFRSALPLDVISDLPAELFPYVQLCDAPRRAPDSVDGLRREARHDRLPPGAGELDLAGLLNALPAGIPISLECPVRSLEALPLDRAARVLFDATRTLLHDIGQPLVQHQGEPA